MATGTEFCRITEIPGKGVGVVASVDITKGTRILCETPILTVRHASISELNETIAQKLRAMTKDQQVQFLSLYNAHTGSMPPFVGITKTNALPCGSDSPIGAIYPTICRINHSCIPNTMHNWNDARKQETIHAVRAIQAGEEITISYDAGQVSDVRKLDMRASFGFECKCPLCSSSPAELASSDARRREIQRLDDAIGNPFAMMSQPIGMLKNCHAIVKLLLEEYGESATVLLARSYYDAFQACVAHGDKRRASVFAERAYRMRLISEGDDSPSTTKMAEYMRSPNLHPSFGSYSTKWGNAGGNMPKNKDSAEFERWLWRESV